MPGGKAGQKVKKRGGGKWAGRSELWEGMVGFVKRLFASPPV